MVALKFDLTGHDYQARRFKDIDYEKAKTDADERQRVVENFIPLIKRKSIISNYIDEDLFQEQVMFVLEKIIPSYNPDKVKFITFLVRLLENNKRDYLRYNNIRQHQNTQQTVDSEDNRTLEDLLLIDEDSPEDIFMKAYSEDMLNKIVDGLDDLERSIIRKYYGFEDNMTLKEIGEEYGFSKQYINQKRNQALHRIRLRMSAYREEAQ